MSDKDKHFSQDSEEYRRWKAGGVNDNVHLCPRGCKEQLEKVEGLLVCNECDGFKVSVDLIAEGTQGMLEKIKGKRKTKEIMLDFIAKGKEKKLICPMCNNKMYEIELSYDPNQVAQFERLFGPFRHFFLEAEHPIIHLIGVAMITAEVVNAAGHISKKIAASVKEKTSNILILDGCRSCESMWFDGEKYTSSIETYKTELDILERFWPSAVSETIKKLDEEEERQKKIESASEFLKNEGKEIRLSPAKKAILESERQKKKIIEEKSKSMQQK